MILDHPLRAAGIGQCVPPGLSMVTQEEKNYQNLPTLHLSSLLTWTVVIYSGLSDSECPRRFPHPGE